MSRKSFADRVRERKQIIQENLDRSSDKLNDMSLEWNGVEDERTDELKDERKSERKNERKDERKSERKDERKDERKSERNDERKPKLNNDNLKFLPLNHEKILNFLVNKEEYITKIDEISKATNVPYGTVRRVLVKLADNNLITRPKRYMAGKFNGIQYTVNDSLCNEFLNKYSDVKLIQKDIKQKQKLIDKRQQEIEQLKELVKKEETQKKEIKFWQMMASKNDLYEKCLNEIKIEESNEEFETEMKKIFLKIEEKN